MEDNDAAIAAEYGIQRRGSAHPVVSLTSLVASLAAQGISVDIVQPFEEAAPSVAERYQRDADITIDAAYSVAELWKDIQLTTAGSRPLDDASADRKWSLVQVLDALLVAADSEI